MRYLSSVFFVNCLFSVFGQTILVPQNLNNSNRIYGKESILTVDSTQTEIPNYPNRDAQKVETKKIESVQKTRVKGELQESQILLKNSYNSRFLSIKNRVNTQGFSRSPSIEQQQEMDQIVGDLKRLAPDSYDYHFAKYLAGNHNVSNAFHLKTAGKLQPNSMDVVVQNVAFYASLLDTNELKVNLKKLIDASWISKEMLQYAENMLHAAPANSVLISHGVQDSYALLFAQLFRAVRLDVHCVSMDILQGERYRENLQKKGFVLPEYKGVNVAYLQAFCQLNRNRNVCLSMTIPKDYLQEMSNQLTVFGLVFVFDFSQNMQVVFEENERFFNRELTTKSLFETPTVSGNCLEANYLPMLMYLSKMYEFSSDVTKLNRVELAILNVVKRCKLDVDKLQIRK
jgi:hypothetical protein